MITPMRVCQICGRKASVGRNRSHAQNRTPRSFRANIQKVKLDVKGEVLAGNFCTKCIQAVKLAGRARVAQV